MKKEFLKFTLLLLVMFVAGNLAAQADTLWTYEDLSTGSLWGVDTDSNDNIVFGGCDASALNFTKLSTDGDVIWNQSYPGYYAGGDLKIDNNDDIWAVASPNNMLLKLDSEGNAITTVCVSPTSTFTSHMCLTPEGNIVTASSNLNSGWQITKISSDCEIIWSQEYMPVAGGDFYIPRGIIADCEGNIIVVGETGAGSYNCVVLKLDSDGNELWQIQPVNHDGSVQDVICDEDNNIFITGTNSVGTYRYIVELDQNGEVTWISESTEINTSFAIGVASNGTILTAGDTNQGGWVGDLRLSANDSDGNEMWSNVMDLSQYEIFYAMKIDSAGNVVCVGNKYIGDTGYGFVAKYSLGEVVLEAPQDVVVDSATGTISWNAPASGTPTGYNIYLDETLLETVTGLSYSYQNLVSNQSYLAGVSAVYTEGESEIVELEFVYSPILPPSNLVVVSNPDENFATFTWDEPAVEDLTGYNVYLDQQIEGNTEDTQWIFNDLTNGQTYFAGVEAVYDNGNSIMVELEFIYSGTGIDEKILVASKLLGNYPNPFNPTTTISFSLIETGNVTIEVFNVKGKIVKQLINEQLPVGQHSVVWNGTDDNNNFVSSGVYFYKMRSGNYIQTRKMILLK
jgi:FlgD Ig-like domain/Fibronectin type III domain